MKEIDLLNAVLEPPKFRKVSSQLQVSHVFVFSLYSIVISVPGPWIFLILTFSICLYLYVERYANHYDFLFSFTLVIIFIIR